METVGWLLQVFLVGPCVIRTAASVHGARQYSTALGVCLTTGPCRHRALRARRRLGRVLARDFRNNQRQAGWSDQPGQPHMGQPNGGRTRDRTLDLSRVNKFRPENHVAYFRSAGAVFQNSLAYRPATPTRHRESDSRPKLDDKVPPGINVPTLGSRPCNEGL